jgi:hypothetical protein
MQARGLIADAGVADTGIGGAAGPAWAGKELAATREFSPGCLKQRHGRHSFILKAIAADQAHVAGNGWLYRAMQGKRAPGATGGWGYAEATHLWPGSRIHLPFPLKRYKTTQSET